MYDVMDPRNLNTSFFCRLHPVLIFNATKKRCTVFRTGYRHFLFGLVPVEFEGDGEYFCSFHIRFDTLVPTGFLFPKTYDGGTARIIRAKAPNKSHLQGPPLVYDTTAAVIDVHFELLVESTHSL